MKSYILQDESDIQLMRDLIERLPLKSDIVDFEETMLLASVRSTTRLWQHEGKIIGCSKVFPYVVLKANTK